MAIITYMQAIGIGFPKVGCHAIGTGADYNTIVWDSGDPIPAKEVLDAWISDYTKAQMWKLIQSERDRRKAGGVKVGDNWFHSDDPSRIQQLGLVMMGANMPPNIMWKTMSGSFVAMTPTLAAQIFQTTASSDMTIFTIAEQKRAAMLASNDPENFDYQTGWPAIYGE